MNIILAFAFLFASGSTLGWVLEVFFRKFFSSQNPEHKWINPGCFTGPYVPLYGLGLCILYAICKIPMNIDSTIWLIIVRFAIFTVLLTLLEFVAGVLSLKVMKVRLWDYSGNFGNVMGVICPAFSFAWGALGTLYAFFVHPHVEGAVEWLAQNLAFSFFIGAFFGVFIVDAVHTLGVINKIKVFARESGIVVRFEELKSSISETAKKNKEKLRAFRPIRVGEALYAHLKEYYENNRERAKEIKKKISGKK